MLADVLKCPACGNSPWMKTSNTLNCRNCGMELAISKEGIILS
jgi:ribosomal protein S27E